MLKKIAMGIALFASVTFANASVINYNGTGNYTRTDDSSGTTISQGSSITPGSTLTYVNSDTGITLGEGGFDAFNLSIGSALNFFFTDSSSALVNLTGTITNVLADINVPNSFDAFVLRSSGDIFSVSGTANYDIQGQLVDNSISVSGQYGNVPEPGTIALMSLGLLGLRQSYKKKQNSAISIPAWWCF